MAKNKVLHQLDLFSSLDFEPEKPNIVDKTIIANNEIVYATDNVGFKIKSKKQADNVEVIDIKEKNVTNINPIEKNKKYSTLSGKRGRKSFKDMDTEIEFVQVPDDETLKKKLYYPIREVATFFNVNTSQIRSWENEFDIIQPRKNRKGDRLFRFEDIKNLQVIYYLLRNKKYSLDGAKKYLKENKGKINTNQQLIQSLQQFKHFLLELKNSLT